MLLIWGTALESPQSYAVCGTSALLSVCWGKMPLWKSWDILWSCHNSQCWSAESGPGLQIQQHHWGAQLYCNYWEDKCLVMHHENALLRCWYYTDNIFLFNLTEEAFVCCDDIGKAERFTLSRLIAIRYLTQLILTGEENHRSEERKGRLKNI